MNSTPHDVFSVPNADAAVQPFPAPAGTPFTLGKNFSTPDPKTNAGNWDWTGLSYSFDVNNASLSKLGLQ